MTSRLTLLGGGLSESQQKYLALYIATGNTRLATELLSAAIKHARNHQNDLSGSVAHATEKFKTAKDAAAAYDRKIRSLPAEAKTKYLFNTTAAEREIARIRAILYSLPSTINTRIYVTPVGGTLNTGSRGGVFAAAGGALVAAGGHAFLAGEGAYATPAGPGGELVSQRGVMPLSDRVLERVGREIAKRAGSGSLSGLSIVGRLDTPWGPAELRGVVREEIRANEIFKGRKARMGSAA